MPKLHQIFYLLAISYSVGVFCFFPKWAVDDAFISFRYGQNLVEHGELNWNPGEDPVEGYTGVVLPVLAAGMIQIGWEPISGMHILGLLFYFLTGFLIFRIMGALRIREPLRAGAILLYACNPLLFTHSLSGLETLLFTFWVSSSLLFFLRLHIKPEGSRTYAIMMSLSLLLCGLTRPEGVLLAIILAILTGIRLFRGYRSRFSPFLLAFSLFYLLPALLYFIWRWNYYGMLLPNSWYAKDWPGFINIESVKSLFWFIALYFALPSIAVFAFIFGKGKPLTIGLRNENAGAEFQGFKLLLIGISLYLLLCSLVYFRSYLFMDYSYRFFIHFIPCILIVLAGFGHFGIGKEIKGLSKRLSLFLGMLVFAQLTCYGYMLQSEIYFCSYYQSIVEDEFKPAAQFINQHISKEETLITYQDAGVVPFYTKLKTVDFGKLNDEFLALNDPAPPEAADYFFEQNAGVLVFTSFDPDSLVYIEEAKWISSDPRFNNYQFVKKFKNGSNFPYYQFIYFRKDLLPSETELNL